MNQKEYVAVLGVGEVTINRFEKGVIQAEATDAMCKKKSNGLNDIIDIVV